MPRADSMSARTGVVPPSRSKVSVTCSGDSVLASMTPRRPESPLIRSTSSDQKGVRRSLMRTQPDPPLLSHLTTSSRAPAFAFGSTASSMSRMIWSARDCPARSKPSLRAPLMRSQDRAMSAETGLVDDAIVAIVLSSVDVGDERNVAAKRGRVPTTRKTDHSRLVRADTIAFFT
jgi:hypothetical protein